MNRTNLSEVKPVRKNFRSFPKTIGNKIVSFLNYPLFTIPFPMKGEHETTRTETTVNLRKPRKHKNPNRPQFVQTKSTIKHITARNTQMKRKTFSYIFNERRNLKEYEKIKFILRACGKNTNTVFSNVLHIEQTKNGSRLIATDGKRMHVTEIGTKIKPGNYKPVIHNGTIKLGEPVSYINFPNWQNVVPTNVVRRGCITINKTARYKNSRIYNSFTKMSGEKINPDFLADLLEKPWVVYTQNEKQKALLLKELNAEKETYAVIMPLSA